MSVRLFDLVDITNKVKNVGRTRAALNDVVGLLSDQRTYQVADNDGTLSAFTPNGQLFVNQWRNQIITETDEDNPSIPKYTGSIYSVERTIDDSGYTSVIQARSPLAIVLQFVVEENDISTYSGYTVNGAQSIGSQTVALTGGTNAVPVGTQVTFTQEIVPRYEVKAATGSPTTSITLDRPLETDVADAVTARFSAPVEKTAARAVYDALNTAGVPAENLGNSFFAIDSARTTANQLIRLHVRIEDKVQTSQHIAKLLELGDLYLSTDVNGIINIREGLAFDGINPGQTLTENEIAAPVRTAYDVTRLLEGYDCLYYNPTDSVVQIASGDVDQFYIDQWANQGRFQPIAAESKLPIDYRYLYNNAATADFYGQQILNYFQVPRITVEAIIKGYRDNNPNDKLQFSLVEDYNISFPISTNNNVAFEPATVVAFEFDEGSQLSRVKFQLTNAPLPGLFKNIIDPVTPVVIEVADALTGFTATFEEIDTNLTLVAEIFFVDKITKILEPILSFSNAMGESTAAFGSAILISGQEYFVRFRTNFRGGLASEPTALFSFTPGPAELINRDGQDLTNRDGQQLINRGV